MKAYIKIIILAFLSIVISTLLVFSICLKNHNLSLKKQIAQQDIIIDSLLSLDRSSVSIDLYVTDKSVNKIYGRYNKGTIQMPSTKTYLLEVDSSDFKMK